MLFISLVKHIYCSSNSGFEFVITFKRFYPPTPLGSVPQFWLIVRIESIRRVTMVWQYIKQLWLLNVCRIWKRLLRSYSSFYLLHNVRLIALRIKNVAEGIYNGNVKSKIYQSKVFFMVEWSWHVFLFYTVKIKSFKFWISIINTSPSYNIIDLIENYTFRLSNIFYVVYINISYWHSEQSGIHG